MIIDHQAHWYPPEFLDALARRREPPRCIRQGGKLLFEPHPGAVVPITELFYDLDLQFEDMRRNGVDAMLSSPGSLGDLSGIEIGEACELSTIVNEAYARAQSAHPGRFLGLAVFPPQDAHAAVQTIDVAIGQLRLRGACLHSNVAGESICGEAQRAMYERLEEWGAPLILHPTRSVAAPALDVFGRELDVALGWMFDTSAAALSLIFSGTLDEFPRLTILHPHLGGVLPYIAARIQAAERMHPGRRTPARPALEYLRERFYTDTVSGDSGALTLARDMYGIDRMLFGSDVPWLTRDDAVEFLRRSTSSADADAIFNNRLPLANAVAAPLPTGAPGA